MPLRYMGGIVSAVNTGLNQPVTQVEYLVVAGGASGQKGQPASNSGAGGGAGGVLQGSNYPVTVGTSITVTVGAGGAGSTSGAGTGSSGGNSVFGNITAVGGGAPFATSPSAINGGSGGGGSYTYPFGLGTPGQGNAGSGTSVSYSGGAGGGAGSAAFSVPGGVQGACGGTGIVSSITGSRVFYAGGGGGTFYRNLAGSIAGLGGAGGGGDGGTNVASPAPAGLPNTGGGGGGTCTDYTANGGVEAAGGNGGSGIVVIRYPSYLRPAASTTGSPQTYVSGAWRVYVWTSSGSITF